MSAPERIYLQHDPEDTGEPFSEAHEVSWCKDKINANDIEYVRADLLPSEKLLQPEWRPWTERPPMAKEPAVYAVLVDCGDGSLEALNDLKMVLANWGPVLRHSGGSNWPDTWDCAWDVRHINYWFPVELGEAARRIPARTPA